MIPAATPAVPRTVSALATAVTALLLVATGTVSVRSSVAPAALASVGGATSVGRATLPPTTTLPPPPKPLPGPLSNPQSLDDTLVATGYKVPPGANVYAAKVTRTDAGLSYDDYQAGGGALGSAFWPASSIKVLAAVGALEFVAGQGFSGAATVSFSGGGARTLRSIYDNAIRVSSNDDYDTLVEVAGVDWLNSQFLTPARGFPTTVIQRSYAGNDVLNTPAITLSEAGRKVTLPARANHVVPECAQGQCSNLFEMSESVRRVVLNDEIPEGERFHIARADVAGISSALLGAEGWIAPAVTRVLGPSARIYSKPGYVSGLDCMDVTLIEAKGQRFLLSATVPDSQGGCGALVTLAAGVLRALTR